MNDASSDSRRAAAVVALVPLFLVSGATSLIYETIWSRQLHLVFGTSQLAISAVLAAFMAGLSLGGLAAARWARAVARPLLAYAGLEAFIGLYALLFPKLLTAVAPVYTAFWRANSPSPLVFGAFQLVLLGLLLLPATTCMGATLPLLARFAARSGGDAGGQVGRLYGANTLGAVLGTGLAGFVLLPRIGLEMTTWLAAGGNAMLALAAAAVGLGAGRLRAETGERDRAGPGEAALWGVAALAGFASLVYEVAWFRVLVLTLGGSAYAFSLMLLAFLLGIGLGGWAGGPLADRAWAQGGRRRVLLWLMGLELGVGGLAWPSMFAYGELPFAFVWIFDLVGGEPKALWSGQLALALAVMLPPCLGMGAAFPFAVRAVVEARDDVPELGGPVGRLYSANTVGSILGAVLGGLWLLPEAHVTGTVLVAVGVNLAAALVAWWAAGGGRSPRRWLALGATAGLIGLVQVAPPPWDPLLMSAGMYKYAADLSDHSREGVLAFTVEPYDLLYYDEGLSSVVTVARSKETGNIWLANNGKVEASTSIDMPTQVLVAHLPFAFAPDARDVLVIGLASGFTVGAVTQQPGPEHIDLVEIEPSIVEASHAFDALNHRPLLDPRLKLTLNDGRNHLTLVPDGTYDLVVAEPSNPWLSGVSNLFTKEFFELGKRKVKPGGVWSQWVQMYGMDYNDLMSLLRTFSAVWPHVRLFSTIEDADLVLVGSESELPLDLDRIDQMIHRDEDVAIDMAGVKVYGAADLLAIYQMDRQQILARAGEEALNTDDNMRIEYSAPLHLYDSTAEANLFSLLHPEGETPYVPIEFTRDTADQVALAEAYGRREEWLRALLVLKAADLLQPGDPEVERLYVTYQAKLKAGLQERK